MANNKTKKCSHCSEEPMDTMEDSMCIEDGTEGENIIMDAEQEVMNHAMSEKHKKRDSKEQKDLINRLSRIEGQIRGIKKMIENDAYCPDVLTQVAATRCALNSFSKVLLARHIKTCVTTDIQDGNEAAVDELVELLQKLMK